MKLPVGLCLLFFFFSCSSKNPLDGLNFYTVQKKAFVNKLDVDGTLESGKMINYNCPVRGYDITIATLTPEGTLVRKGDTICYLVCTELENNYLDAVKNLDLAKSDYEKAKAQQVLENKILESEVKTIEASAAISMLDSSRLDFYTPARRKISELTLQKSTIQKELYQHKLAFKKRIDAAVLSKLNLKIQQQENKVKRYSEDMTKLKIVADTSGIILYANTWATGQKAKVGDVIWGRSPLINVIDVSSLQVRLTLNETEFKLINKGDKLQIRINALDTNVYKGIVTQKFPEGKPVEKNSSVKYFEAMATIEPRPAKIQPGISVSCSVILCDIKDALAVPLVSVFDSDSTKVVYKIVKNKCKKVKVKTGLSGEKEIVIQNGLKPGDRILLAEPPQSVLY